MTLEDVDVSRLEELLEQERALLLAGDLEGLGALLPLKEELVETFLSDFGANREKILPLEMRLQRNQVLLGSALDGIRAVATRLAALRQVRVALDIYDAQGRKQNVAASSRSKVEKRA
ncbi:hypothetical protein GGR95_001840 [Sulfitobacter undariae]|uniref:FlgN protein n=1 Tax=Sulfitobacter undariae TaxID=1563671 RepID=A0A7W6EAD3_9RHOB|nr:hypothetical protein [Sulfitobacter undariae]MBB3994199.1 hypothetical protein [Sulfitobacter undariae]